MHARRHRFAGRANRCSRNLSAVHTLLKNASIAATHRDTTTGYTQQCPCVMM